MAYLSDLSDYNYFQEFWRPSTKAVGWLARDHDFPQAAPSEDLLNRLWQFCSISVAQTRGGHYCDWCPPKPCIATRMGQSVLLGTSEIRVFSKSGAIYAAPTLIYHYVDVHSYRQPDEFLRALFDGPAPPASDYMQELERFGFDWHRRAPSKEG